MATIPTINLGGSNLPPEILEQQQALNRQQQMAQLLMQQGQKTPQGQMIGNRYIPPSFTQNLAKLANTYVGAELAKKGDKQALKLAEQLRQQYGDELQQYRKIYQGQEAVPEQVTEMAGPYGQGVGDGGMNVPMPTATIEGRASIPANRQGAYDFASRAYNPLLQQIGAKKLTEGPMKVGVDDTLVDPITNEIIFKGAGKPPAPTTDMQNFLFAKERGEIPQNMGFLGYQKYIKQLSKDTEGGSSLPTVNNNGLPVGRFDKTGRYISPQGRVFPASAVTEAQKEHDVTMDLANKLNNLTKGDIKNAFGSVMDYTASKVGQMVGRKDVVDAQNKINSIQIKNVLDNLSQLKGASSDKEMAQMIKDFPAYTADPEIMEKWTDRAAKTANRFLKRSEQRYGFDTEYAQEDRFTGNKEKDQPINKLSTQDQEALNWANANPKDPRSAQIKSRLNK